MRTGRRRFWPSSRDAQRGFIAVASGNFSIEFDPGAIVPYDGPVSFYFDEDELPFAGELEIRAIDLNGNIGPPTIVEVSSSTSHRRFASLRGSGPVLTYGLVGLALVIARRRRRRRIAVAATD